jgi:hypothetical protein
VEQVALIGGHVTDCDPLGNSKHKEDPLSAGEEEQNKPGADDEEDDVVDDAAPARAKLGFAALVTKTRRAEYDED